MIRKSSVLWLSMSTLLWLSMISKPCTCQGGGFQMGDWLLSDNGDSQRLVMGEAGSTSALNYEATLGGPELRPDDRNLLKPTGPAPSGFPTVEGTLGGDLRQYERQNPLGTGEINPTREGTLGGGFSYRDENSRLRPTGAIKDVPMDDGRLGGQMRDFDPAWHVTDASSVMDSVYQGDGHLGGFMSFREIRLPLAGANAEFNAARRS